MNERVLLQRYHRLAEVRQVELDAHVGSLFLAVDPADSRQHLDQCVVQLRSIIALNERLIGARIFAKCRTRSAVLHRTGHAIALD